MQNGLTLLDASVRHLGTDINYVVLENLYAFLKDRVGLKRQEDKTKPNDQKMNQTM